MADQKRTAVLALLVVGLGAGLLYTKVISPWVGSKEIAAVKPTIKSRTRSKGKTSEPAKPETKATIKPELPPQVLPPPAPDPGPFAYRGQVFEKLDQNRDRFLSPEEIPAVHRNALLKQDRDGNGKIDVIEFDAGLAGLELPAPAKDAPRHALLTPPDPKTGFPVYVPKTETKSDLPDWFLDRDKDGDRQIGLYEWPAGGLEEFQRLDANSDGFITADEAKRAQDSKRVSKSK
ncbi:MAG: EF-hand domain-containing protein [Planctomycetota bacterium]